MPPRVITIANTAKKYMQAVRSNPDMLLMASAPRNRMNVRLTTTYSSSQKTAMINPTVSLYRWLRNCGIVKILFFRYTGMKNTATINKVSADIHSYEAMASPILKPEPLIPMNCSAEILEAISDAPMAHQVNFPSARKYSFVDSLADRFR